jgi:5-methylcytosine-specific restriction endonuclease McrA
MSTRLSVVPPNKPTMQIDTVRCEVLNASYEPLSVVSGRRGLRLVLTGKASILAEHPTYYIISANNVHAVPTQVLLKEMVKSRRITTAQAQLTKRNMFVRDMYRCQYCARHRAEIQSSGGFLTRDHVQPQSKGGKDVWTNVVTACNKCNNKKADFALDEIGMRFFKPTYKPYPPTVFEIWSKSSSKKKQDPNT